MLGASWPLGPQVSRKTKAMLYPGLKSFFQEKTCA